jgi:TPR repeat protein
MSVLFLLCVVSAASEVYAQNKDACDLVSKADIEAAVGQSLHLQSQTPQRCAYATVDPATDYERELNSLVGKIGPQAARAGVYLMSEDRARVSIISHCKAMAIGSGSPGLQPYLTNDEVATSMSPAGQAKTKADVLACMKDYDAKEISANRKAAIEYCFQLNDYTKGSSSAVQWFDYCMNRHDMLQAMCNRASAFIMAYQKRKNPEMNYVAQPCPGVRPNPQEIQAIQAVSAPAVMDELPPRFFALPNVVVPPGPQLPIPAGTVLNTRLSGGLYAINVAAGQFIDVRLEQALAVGGQTVLPANSHITLKTRIVGPSTSPGTVQIGLTTDRAIMPDGKYADVKSDELIFTVTKEPKALEGGGIPFDAKLRFTVSAPSAPAALPAAVTSPSAPSSPPKRLDVVIAVTYSTTPNPAAVEQFEKRIDETTYEDPIAVPGVSDAAFWIARSPDTGGAALSVFSGGKTTLHIGGDVTLDQAKALAAKALGTASKIGFSYGTPSPFKKPVLGPRPTKPGPIEQLKFDLTAKAEKGNPRVQFALGNFYENGIIGPDGIPKPDYPAAAYWYQEASDRGQPEASFALAMLYRDGRGMNPNPAAALILFRKAAMAGFVPAMAPLTVAYMDTSSETTGGMRANRWAVESAKAGDPEGHLNLGYLWYKGRMGGGKPYTYQKAMEEFLKAAEGGDCVAMMNIGGLYFNGDGVPQDKQQAESWFAKAKTCGGSDLDWMRDKAARYQQKAAKGELPPIPTPPPGAALVKLGNSILSMMSMTLGMDVLAADSEDKLANMSLGEILGRAQKNRKSACALSGFAKNMGMSPAAC